MCKRLLFLCSVSSLLYAAGVEEGLQIHSYDSFSAEWGLGKVASELFRAAELRITSTGDTVDMLLHAASFREGEQGRPDVVVGIANITVPLVRELDFLQGIQLETAPAFREGVDIVDGTLIPFDVGYLAFVYDSQLVGEAPKSLEDLTDDRFEKSIVLMDPRTSGPGLAFLYWSVAVYGEAFPEYWERLRPSILTVPESWSTAYGLFTAGEAPLVLSFTTSPAYHRAFENEDKYRAAPFSDGHYRYVEYLAIPKTAARKDLAEEFVAFVLSEEFQKEVPLGNIMYPALQGVPLPDSFREEIPAVAIELDHDLVAANKDRWIADWLKVMQRAP